MNDPLGYAGKRVIVGGGASGMGAATTAALVELGADVVVVDVKPPTVEVGQFQEIDLRDKASIDAGVAALVGPIDALFCCAGLPGPPFSGLDVARVNFFGTRYLIESLLPSMARGAGVAWVSSNGGLGWQQNLELLTPALEAEGWDAGEAWMSGLSEVLEQGAAYPISKQLVNAYTASRATRFYNDHGVRLNCTNPGPTATPMMPSFEEANGKKVIAASLGPIERYSTAEEQAWPLVYLNSPRSSYITGEALMVDGGFFGAMQVGQIDVAARFAEAFAS
jgi:NAD(P)-dependent dehydrogenase (short-subunit alcohol dehydrogenase family)